MWFKLDSDFYNELKDFFKDIAIIITIVVVVKVFLFVPFQINGSSMDESYYDKQFIIVDRLSYRFSDIDRGDVVVFRPHVSWDKEFFIKRVVGLPGDTIKIEGGMVYLKTQADLDYSLLDEGYLNENNTNSTFVSGKSSPHLYEVPEGQYFVMWDNRNSSTDSRTCFRSCVYPDASNYISKSDVNGRVWIDLGYFDWIRIQPWFKLGFGSFSFTHPTLWIDTSPKWFSSADSWDY